jgi:hypothetical protein
VKSVRRSKVPAADDCAQGETGRVRLSCASRPGSSRCTLRGAVASIFDAAGAAEAIRREIGGLFRDGTLAFIMASILTTA